MPFDFGDIVLVPFPFTSRRASKKQPAVVVSGRA
jgi:mRNA interferase MazF